MSLVEYFVYTLRSDIYRKRTWVLNSFLRSTSENIKDDDSPWVRDAKWYFLNKESGKEEEITDADPEVRLLNQDHKINLRAGDLPNLKRDVITTFGNAMFNMVALVYPYGDTIEYINGKVTGKMLNRIIATRLKDKSITIAQYRKFFGAMDYLTVFSNIVGAASPAQLKVAKTVTKARDEAVKLHKDNLSDPATVALVDEAITNAIRESLKDDEVAQKFILKDKGYKTVLKKMYGSIGGSESLTDSTKVDFIARSLAEGWRPEDMPTIINGLRIGSFERGAGTALGGYAVKILARAFTNLKISERDCGTNIGLPIDINSLNVDGLVGRYVVGRVTPMNSKDTKANIGKMVLLRDPNGCKSKNGNYCEVCLGDNVAKSGIGLGSQLASLGSLMLSMKLAAFHVKELSLQEYFPAERIR